MRYYARAHVSMLLVLILDLLDLTGASSSSCPSYCGNISIPYPFGIGEGCYLNNWFEIQCNNSPSGDLVPYLPKINKEVVSVNLSISEDVTSLYPYGSLLIKTNITSTGCSNSSLDGRRVGEVLNFTGSPFTIGASNILIALGCNNKATLTHLEPRLVGCMSSCEPTIKGHKSKCNGYRCCQAVKLVVQDLDAYPEDVDECQFKIDGKFIYCTESETCVNTQGSYRCVNKRIKIVKITIGISVGFGVLIFTSISFWIFKFIKRQKEINRKKKFFKRNGGLLLQQQLISRKGNIEKTTVFNSKELEKATENYSLTRILGQGSQGTVYKGMLVDGSIIAVKKSKVVDEDKIEDFINEVVILSQINHRNIVKLLGCCLETEVPLLVYEFIPNGNLFEHLHDESDDYTLATWEVRLRIALDVAEALSYLHSAATSPIYHRDIKSMNIMLDEKYRGKVSDFGTSRSVTVDHTHLTTLVSGTAGYVDPEYYQSSQFTDKSDVYSFGVVLAELITGQKPISIFGSQENRTLATYFILALKDNKLVDIIDCRIRDDCKLEQVIATAQLAKRCLNRSGKNRPNMREVAMELERIRTPNGNSQSHIQIVENDVDELAVINIGVESSYNKGVTASSVLHDKSASTSWLDAETLFPRRTW